MHEVVILNLLHMHGGCRYEKWYLLHMNEGVISTSVEHVLGSSHGKGAR